MSSESHTGPENKRIENFYLPGDIIIETIAVAPLAYVLSYFSTELFVVESIDYASTNKNKKFCFGWLEFTKQMDAESTKALLEFSLWCWHFSDVLVAMIKSLCIHYQAVSACKASSYIWLLNRFNLHICITGSQLEPQVIGGLFNM